MEFVSRISDIEFSLRLDGGKVPSGLERYQKLCDDLFGRAGPGLVLVLNVMEGMSGFPVVRVGTANTDIKFFITDLFLTKLAQSYVFGTEGKFVAPEEPESRLQGIAKEIERTRANKELRRIVLQIVCSCCSAPRMSGNTKPSEIINDAIEVGKKIMTLNA